MDGFGGILIEDKPWEHGARTPWSAQRRPNRRRRRATPYGSPYGSNELLQEPDSTALTVPPGQTPGAVGVRPELWDVDSTPARYEIGVGDTYVGLAKTYLDPLGTRWKEIWLLNKDVHPNPNVIVAGDVIRMPAEARDNFLAWMSQGEPSSSPAQLSRERRAGAARGWSTGQKVAAGVAVLAVLGIGAYALTA